MSKLLKKDNGKFIQPHHWIFGIMLVAALIGLLASFVLTVDKFEVLANPNAVLSCSINAALNCSRVMESWQASLLGFPNTLIGLMAYPVIILIAVLGLIAVKLPRWFFVAANVGFLLSTVFSYWLFFQSLYSIQVLCPWCLSVTFAETLIIASAIFYNLRENNFGFKKAANEKIQSFLNKGYYQVVVISLIVVLVALVFLKFGSALFA